MTILKTHAMEAAALTLSSTLQINPLRSHKPTITINPRNKTMTFHQPTSFRHGHLQVMCGHKSRHVAHAVRSGEMNGDEGKRARGAVSPTVALACVLGTMCLTLPMCRPSLGYAYCWPLSKNPRPALEEKKAQRKKEVSTSPTVVSTLEALMNMDKTVIIATDKALKRLEKATRITPTGLPKLQEAARALAFSGDKVAIDEAVGKLWKKYENLVKDNRKLEAYEIGLVLVEMLIYQGKYLEAKNLVEELDIRADVNILENTYSSLAADHKLYKAVILLMLGDEPNAFKFWNAYKNPPSSSNFLPALPPDQTSQNFDAITFGDFIEQIKKLRQKIEARR